jgi:glycosyltransferase involved in cell wall biosynthesis
VPWKYSFLNQILAMRAMRSQAAKNGCDAVITTADETFYAGVPTFAYQDMNFEITRRYADVVDRRFLTMQPTSNSHLSRLAERQLAQYGALSGVLSMSQWFRDELIAQGVSPTAIKVVGAGISSVAGVRPPLKETKERTKLIFVGLNFERKGGDLVLAAVGRLRKEGGLPLTLTVVGPATWPGRNDPPSWVHFVGSVPPDVVGGLLLEHDLFVMPSRFDAYGIAFLEAQAAGLPCIARRAFAMTEIIPEGRGGFLVGATAGIDELADTIASALCNDDLYERIGARAAEVREQNSWNAVAQRSIEAVTSQLAS